MPIPGRFIVIEGLEGAGKTTAIETIKQYLATKIKHVIVTREPGGTYLGEELRTLVKNNPNTELLDAHCELLLMYAARIQLLKQVIWPALARGDWVISDRFEPSTYAYQGGGRGISQHIIDNLSVICLQGFKPDLIIFLDISPEQGLLRIQKRGKSDRFEQESADFFAKVYAGYHQYIQTMDNICIVDASQSLDVVQDSIIQLLSSKFKLNHTHV